MFTTKYHVLAQMCNEVGKPVLTYNGLKTNRSMISDVTVNQFSQSYCPLKVEKWDVVFNKTPGPTVPFQFS